MPERKKLAESVTEAGKQALASDTAQVVVGTIADKVQELALERAEGVSQTIKERAAKAGGREPLSLDASPGGDEQAPPSVISTVKDKAAGAATMMSTAKEKAVEPVR